MVAVLQNVYSIMSLKDMNKVCLKLLFMSEQESDFFLLPMSIKTVSFCEITWFLATCMLSTKVQFARLFSGQT